MLPGTGTRVPVRWDGCGSSEGAAGEGKDWAEEERAIDTYRQALSENPKQPSCLKNMGLIYEKRGRIAEEDGRRDEADRWFDEAADVWTQAVRLNPGGYLDIENWLKSTGRSNVDVYF